MQRDHDATKLNTAIKEFTERFFDPNRTTLLDGRPVTLIELSTSLYADKETLTRFPGSTSKVPAILIGYQHTMAPTRPPITIHLPRMHDGIPVIYACMVDSTLN